jgi:hypothetical protein
MVGRTLIEWNDLPIAHDVEGLSQSGIRWKLAMHVA